MLQILISTAWLAASGQNPAVPASVSLREGKSASPTYGEMENESSIASPVRTVSIAHKDENGKIEIECQTVNQLDADAHDIQSRNVEPE